MFVQIEHFFLSKTDLLSQLLELTEAGQNRQSKPQKQETQKGKPCFAKELP